MKTLKSAFGASALALLVSAPAAWADVSAKDVWAQWQDYATRSGLSVTSTGEAVSGKTTTYSGVKLTMTSDEIGYTSDIGDVVMTENTDGTVSITTPASYPMKFSSTGADSITADLKVSQEGLVLTASGTPDSINYAYAADSFTLELLGIEGETAEGAAATGALKLGKSQGKSVIGSGEVQPFSSDFTSENLSVQLDVTTAEEGVFNLSMTSLDVTGSSEGALPAGIDPEDLGALLKGGMKAIGKLGFGQTTYSVQVSDEQQTLDLSSTMESGALDFDLTEAGMRYATSAKGMGLTVESSDLPLGPLSMTLKESAFGFGMPIAQSDEPQDFSFLTKVIGLEIDESIWGMFDPMSQLPRDPINIVLDLAGKGNWLVDITAPEAAEVLNDAEMPGQLHALDIRELELTAIGASLTGAGAFTFNNDDLESWGGMPAPEGKLDLQLVGANKLIDTLVDMGFVPQDQAMMAKMSMGMFAKPGAGEDTLVSTIEVKEDGSVFANGQQLQ